VLVKVLMVEDEKYMAKAVVEILKRNNYTVDWASDGSLGLEYALTDTYDLIILDIMLPKTDGLTILEKIRAKGLVTVL
jgi:DNA-binding response OmpR family regulator